MRSFSAGVSLLALAASPALAQSKRIDPYIEVDQVLTADISGDGDVLTYSSVAAGLDAAIDTKRVRGQISYRYEHRFAWNGNVRDSDVHSGLARADIQVIPRLLQFEVGGIATRTLGGYNGGFLGNTLSNADNLNQIYSVYAGPTLSTSYGALDIRAAYRAGFTKVDGGNSFQFGPNGRDRLDLFDRSISQSANLSVGMKPGATGLPFGWTVTGGWDREDSNQLDQVYEGRNVRADLIVPVTRTIALVGGIGYEDIENSQRRPLLDEKGQPVVDRHGRFVTDKSKPRVSYFDQNGVIWDVGVLWRPTRRTELEARIGRRYGGMSYTGHLNHQFSRATSLQLVVYDGIQTFGRQLNNSVSSLPTQFQVVRNPLSPGFGGCVFSPGDQSAGGCFNDALQAVSTGSFRSRGVSVTASTKRGPWSIGLGGGYSTRRYIAPVFDTGFSINGRRDHNIFFQAVAQRQLTADSGVSVDSYVNWYHSNLFRSSSTISAGLTGTYHHRFGRLTGFGSLGIYGFDPDDSRSVLTVAAQVGLRYNF